MVRLIELPRIVRRPEREEPAVGNPDMINGRPWWAPYVDALLGAGFVRTTSRDQAATEFGFKREAADYTDLVLIDPAGHSHGARYDNEYYPWGANEKPPIPEVSRSGAVDDVVLAVLTWPYDGTAPAVATPALKRRR